MHADQPAAPHIPRRGVQSVDRRGYKPRERWPFGRPLLFQVGAPLGAGGAPDSPGAVGRLGGHSLRPLRPAGSLRPPAPPLLPAAAATMPHTDAQPPSLPAGIMAHITAVRLKAFKSVAGGWQEFRFDRGLNAIVGECVSADEAGRRQLMLVVGVQVPPAMLTGCLPSCRPQWLRQVIPAGCPLLCLCGSAPHVCRRLAGRPGQQRQQRGAQQLLGLAAECAAETCMSAAPRCTTLMQPVLMLALCPGVRGGSQPAQRRRRGTHGGGSSHARRRPRLQGQRQVRQCMQSSVLLCAPCVLVSQRLRCTPCALLASQLPAAQVRVRSGGACAGETLLTVQSALSFIPPANLAAG